MNFSQYSVKNTVLFVNKEKCGSQNELYFRDVEELFRGSVILKDMNVGLYINQYVNISKTYTYVQLILSISFISPNQ